MTLRLPLLVGFASCLVVGIGLTPWAAKVEHRSFLAEYYAGSPETVYDSSTASFTSPAGSTSEEITQVLGMLRRGEDLPSGFESEEHQHTVARRSEMRDPLTGMPVIEVLLDDRASALAIARLTLDGEVVSEATRSNGKLEDRGDRALAHLSFSLPWIPAFDAELVWEDECGTRSSESLSIGPRWLRWGSIGRWWREHFSEH
jgi:hypothetical protein